MQSWANKAAILIAALWTTALAATPPRVVTVTETLFGRNADTLLILRHVHDNHGLHQVWQTDTLIVSRSLIDGADRGFAPVDRVIDYGTDGIDGTGQLPRIQDHTPEHARDPYAFRRDAGAWPLQEHTRHSIPTNIDAAGLTLTGHDDRQYHLSLGQVQAYVEDTLLSVRGVQPALQVMSDDDPFDPYAFDIASHCQITGTHTLYHTPQDPMLAQLTCGNEDDLQSAVLWIVVPLQ